MRCNLCGLDYYSHSMGGPGICPACDCGVLPETSRLRAAQQMFPVLGGLTADDVRRIVREELIRLHVITDKSDDL